MTIMNLKKLLTQAGFPDDTKKVEALNKIIEEEVKKRLKEKTTTSEKDVKEFVYFEDYIESLIDLRIADRDFPESDNKLERENVIQARHKLMEFIK